MRLSALLILFFVLLTPEICSQAVISVEIRPRTEYSHGLKSLASPDQMASIATSQRSRLNVGYTAEKLGFYVSLQDVRTWGNQSQLVGNEAKSTSVHQAWGEVRFTPDLSLKAGRMELVYDDHRIFGNVGWAQQARSHDLALLKYENGFKAHVGVAHNEDGVLSNNVYTTPRSYKSMQYLWLNKGFDKLNVSALVLNNGIAYATKTDEDDMVLEQGIRYSLTAGVYAKLELLDGLSLDGNFYSQSGSDAAGKDLSAYEFAFNLSGKLSDKIGLSAGFESLSGTDYDETEKNMSFSPLYGTNHKFNGFMDYFFVGNHANNVGLNDAYLKGSLKLGNVMLGAHYHYFSAAAAIAAGADSYLGSEIDLTCGYNFTKGVNLSCGYSHMLASESMELIKSGDSSETNNWAWLMLTINTAVFTFNK